MRLLTVPPGDPLQMSKTILRELGQESGTSAVRRSKPFDIIRPKSLAEATPNTLSSRFGLQTFPQHTECAHWPAPPRYLVLCCIESGGRADTMVTDLATALSDLKAAAASIPFLCRQGLRSFHVTLYEPGPDLWRYDTSCLLPVNTEGHELVREISQRIGMQPAQAIAWTPGLVGVIDNWCEAHGRADARLSPGRRLLRMVIG